MKIIKFIVLLCFPLIVLSQEKAGIELNHYLKSVESESKVPLLLKSENDLSEAITNAGGYTRMKIDNFYSIEIPASKVMDFLSHPAIEKVDFSSAPAKKLNDSMRINNNIDSLQKIPQRFPSSHTGKGVIMGIIDSGIDFSHPDFKDSTGKTRILHIWDQTVATNPARAPQPYNYGVEWDSSDINSGICTHEDPAGNFGHGTMVAGTAAGNALATGNYKGAAPASDLIVIASDFNRINWLQSVAEAIDYIFKKADQLNRPCVINISAGTYAGSHDGKDIAAQIIDQLIKSKKGRTVVAAAGNAGQVRFHLGYDVTQDTSFTWLEYENNLFTNGGIFFEVFADTADFNNVHFGFGADKIQGRYSLRGHTAFRSIHTSLNKLNIDTLKNPQGVKLAIIKTYAEENDGVYSMEVAIFPDSTSYNYRFSTFGNGRFDVWSSYDLMGSSDIISTNLPSVSVYPAMAGYKSPDTLQSMVSSFTCLPSVITVANYINRNSYPSISGVTNMGVTAGEISPNSSLGPTRNGGLKPDVSAPGDIVISPSKLNLIQQLIQSEPEKISADSMHMRNGGTSMAAPGVAGILALYLEKCPNANYLDMKNVLINNTRKDSYTPLNFSNKWGHGKVDAYQTLLSSNFHSSISTGNISICEGDTAIIHSDYYHTSYLWSNDDTNRNAQVDSSGSYFLIATDSLGCRSISDTITVSFNNSPAKPVLTLQNDTIYSSFNGIHKWYFNGSIIPGENSNKLHWTSYGNYLAEAIDTSNCSTFSDTLNISITSLPYESKKTYKLYPNPTECVLNVHMPLSGIYMFSLMGIEGKLLFEKEVYLNMQPYPLDLCPIDKGVYIFSVEGNNKKISHKLIIQ